MSAIRKTLILAITAVVSLALVVLVLIVRPDVAIYLAAIILAIGSLIRAINKSRDDAGADPTTQADHN